MKKIIPIILLFLLVTGCIKTQIKSTSNETVNIKDTIAMGVWDGEKIVPIPDDEEDYTLGCKQTIITKSGFEAHLLIPDKEDPTYVCSFNMTNNRGKGVLTIYYNKYGDSINSQFTLYHKK